MALLRDLKLLPASVRREAGFLHAARRLLAAHTSAIAVLDNDDHVVGLFTDDALLRGLFPGYLEDLHHTAFLTDGEALQATAEAVAGQPVARYMREPVVVDVDAGAAHVVERFLHTPWGAIAVVENGRFLGMVDQLDFTELLIDRLDLAAE